MALEVVDADHSNMAAAKIELWQTALLGNVMSSLARTCRQFTFVGPNGRHLCLILPVFGPSAAELSHRFDCRLTPPVARLLAYQAETSRS